MQYNTPPNNYMLTQLASPSPVLTPMLQYIYDYWQTCNINVPGESEKKTSKTIEIMSFQMKKGRKI